MSVGWEAPIERVELCLGDEGQRLPHARIRHLTRATFPDKAQLAPDLETSRLFLLVADDLAVRPDALRSGVTSMASNLKQARQDGADIPSITFRLLAKGGMLVEELEA